MTDLAALAVTDPHGDIAYRASCFRDPFPTTAAA